MAASVLRTFQLASFKAVDADVGLFAHPKTGEIVDMVKCKCKGCPPNMQCRVPVRKNPSTGNWITTDKCLCGGPNDDYIDKHGFPIPAIKERQANLGNMAGTITSAPKPQQSSKIEDREYPFKASDLTIQAIVEFEAIGEAPIVDALPGLNLGQQPPTQSKSTIDDDRSPWSTWEIDNDYGCC